MNRPLAACVAGGATGAMPSINLRAPVATGMCVIGRRLCGNMGLSLASEQVSGIARLNDAHNNRTPAKRALPFQNHGSVSRRCH